MQVATLDVVAVRVYFVATFGLGLIQPRTAGRNRIGTAGVTYKTSTGFNVAALAVVMILVALYATWW